MKIIVLLFVVLISQPSQTNLFLSKSLKIRSSVEEKYEGFGILQCFGNMTVSTVSGQGTAKCRPEFENPDFGITSAPQGFIADGEDGSHWVVVDDRGTADCEGQITFNIGDHNLGYCSYPPTQERGTKVPEGSFCGHFTCEGYIQLSCHMGIGCHGA